MSMSTNTTILAEQGARVLIHQVMQDDPERQFRVVRGLAHNAVRHPSRLDNPPACGAPKDWPWGYLPCGCCNCGFGHHTYRHYCWPRGEVWWR